MSCANEVFKLCCLLYVAQAPTFQTAHRAEHEAIALQFAQPIAAKRCKPHLQTQMAQVLSTISMNHNTPAYPN